MLRYCRPTVVYAHSITVYERKLRKFAYSVLVKSWKILRQDLEKRFSILSVKLIHFYFTVILNEMSILRMLITWESSTY